jgi:hypothetical protein
MVSTSVFQDQSGAEDSNRRAADYVRQNLAPLLPNPPQITAGEVVAYKANMPDDLEFVVNLVLPKDVAQKLQTLPIDGFRVEAVTAPSEDQTARFGIAEAVVLFGVIKAGEEVVKLGLEIWKLLQEQAAKKSNPNLSATISTPDGGRSVLIAADMQSGKVEEDIKRTFP